MFGRRKGDEPQGVATFEDPQNAITLDETSELFRLFAGMYSTATGVSVTSDSAVASVAVLACLLVRAESLMLCPVDVYEKRGRERHSADDHPVATLIADEPNPILSAEEFWRWKQITEDLRGNAYVRVEWYRGNPVALWPMIGNKPRIKWGGQDNRVLLYEYDGDEFTKAGTYPSRDIMHFKGPLLSRTPYEARSLVEVTAENIGLGIASEQFFARFLGNGSHFPKYLQSDNTLEQKDIDAIANQMKDQAGLLPAGALRIFDRGLKVMQSDMSLKDADLSEHQRWILEQVCRTWRVTPQMVQDLTHGTYTNSEQADLWLSKHTVSPIVRNTEGVIRRALFLRSERKRLYAKFNVNAMMRGDFAARTAGYSILINCGVLSPNEARAFEDWNPYEGGDEYRVPLNTGPAGEPDPEALVRLSAHPVSALLAPMVADAKERIMARHAQNQERGRDVAETVAFASVVMAPIVQTAKLLDLALDADEMVATVLPELGM